MWSCEQVEHKVGGRGGGQSGRSTDVEGRREFILFYI